MKRIDLMLSILTTKQNKNPKRPEETFGGVRYVYLDYAGELGMRIGTNSSHCIH